MKEKQKILHLIKSLGRGGAEMLLPETLKVHNQNQFEFHYIYFLPWKDQVVEEIKMNGGKVTCFPSSNNFGIISWAGAISKYIKGNQIQLVHCHLPWAGVVGRILHRWTGVPVLYTEHNKQERYHFLTRWVNRFTFNWQTGVIAVSKDVADSIELNIQAAVKIHQISNGVNTDFFQRDEVSAAGLKQKLGIPLDSIVVGTLAVFRFQKRLKEWIDIFDAVSRENPKLYGIIAGDGPLKSAIETEINNRGLVEKIKLPGLQTDVKPWLSAMDIFMMSSVFEGLPIALLEAMSMGCAVVSTDAGGIKEVIRNNVDGLVVPANNWKDLGKELSKLVKDSELRFSFGKAARQRVVLDFGLKKMVLQIEDLYKGILLSDKRR